MRSVTILLLITLGLPASLARAEHSSLQRCLTIAAEQANFSGSITISRGSRELASVYRGRLAGPSSRLIDKHTRFNLGSASKMFTAVAIGQLIELGKLRLDEPVGEVVTGLTPETSRVTIRQLLDHTSGLGNFFRPENMDAMLRARSATALLPLIANERPSFSPGAHFAYSNSGFAILGIVIERLTGMTYGAYLARYVFSPAHMIDTGLSPQPLSTLAIGMTSEADHDISVQSDHGSHDGVMDNAHGLTPAPGATEGYASSAGGVFSTASDLERFGIALSDGSLLQAATLGTFVSPQVESEPATAEHPSHYYGLGFTLDEDGEHHWVGHSGGTLGVNSAVLFDLKDQLIVSVLSNRDPPAATRMMHAVREHLEKSIHGVGANEKRTDESHCAIHRL